MNNETKHTIEPSLTEAGNDLDVGLKNDGQIKEPVYLAPSNNNNTSVPLFMRDGRNCDQGNAQDEKDATEE